MFLMPRRETARLAAALLASLALHLTLVADIAHVQWPLPTIPSNHGLPLEVRLLPISSRAPMPVSTVKDHSSAFVTSVSGAVEPEDDPEPLPVVGNIVDTNLVAVAPEPTFTATPANAFAPLAEPSEEEEFETANARPRDRRRAKRTRLNALPPGVGSITQQEEPLQRLPASGKLIYRFYWGKAHWLAGDAIHEWIVTGGYYTLSSTVRTTGLFGLFHPTQLVETAQGRVIGDRLLPQQFSTQFNDYPPLLAYFDWATGIFRWRRGNTSSTSPLPANAYDKISFLYQLYLAPAREGWSSTHITTGTGLIPYDIEHLGVTDLEIEGRIFPTMHLRKIASSTDSSVIEVWLSTAHKLPLKIAYATPAGDYFEQVIAPDSMPGD